jgi:arylsulfatase A-like enzyme/Flp pilus assembly protein TadD
MRLIRWAVCFGSLASALAAASQLAATKPGARAFAPPNIVLITLDTTRSDRMGFLGSKRGLTPNLDGLAGQSAVFTHAYAQAPLTSPSHASILSGTYPQFHGVIDFPMALATDVPYAPEILRDRGYRTAAFVGSVVLDPTIGAPGFDRGFDTYDADFRAEDFHEKNRYQTIERRGGEVMARALAWLNQHPKGPFFLWVHLYDAHDPYDPPEPYKSRYPAEAYDGEIAYVDAMVGKLLRQLKARGLYDGATIAVTADHGEALGAHGEDTHGIFLYDETIQVPLLIKLPRARSAGKRIENQVELVDVLPTLLQTAGIEVPKQVQGESLLGLMKSGGAGGEATAGWHDHPAYAQSDYAHLAYGWSSLQSLRAGKYLFIQAPRPELYDQRADPKAEHNLAPASTAVADTLAGQLQAFLGKTSSTRVASNVAVDPAAQQKLAALGYVASGNTVPKSADRGADPKDRIETANAIHRLNFLTQDGRFQEAVPILQQLIAKDPGITILYFMLSGCYIEMEQFDKAIPVLRKAVELDPDFTGAQMNLGKALLAVHDYDGAAAVFEGLVAKKPTLVDAQVSLEIAYAGAKRVPEEIKQCRKVLEFLPDDYPTYLNLGRFLAMSGDLEGAVPSLQKAAALQPIAPLPHLYLSQVYARLGRAADAARERTEAIRLGAAPPGPGNAAPGGGDGNPNPE